MLDVICFNINRPHLGQDVRGLLLPAYTQGLCLRFATSSLLGHAQTPKYFSSRNELLSQGGNPVPDCPGLTFTAWVGPGRPGPGHGLHHAGLYIPNLH